MIGRMTAPTRRQFLATSAALPLAAGAVPARPATPTADAVIFILMTGGPSQLDTFDPKPDAPADIRGPFRTIPTRTPGVRVSELFPKLAGMSHRWSLIRSMTSDAPPIHEVGMQLVNTGRRFTDGVEWPSANCVITHLRGDRVEDCWPPRHVVMPLATVDYGGGLSLGFGSGFLHDRLPYWLGGLGVDDFLYGHLIREGHLSPSREYGDHPFGFNLSTFAEDLAHYQPRRLITVNMFQTVFDAPSWDCHADGGSLACDLGDYRDTVGPLFDHAVSRLLTDLHDRGLLDRTLVVATGEFGRTPKPNCNGGRDHWPGCWTTLIAGGGVKGGQVVGRSDATASAPADRPVSPAELVATIFHAVGIPADATMPGPAGEPVAVSNAAPVRELF